MKFLLVCKRAFALSHSPVFKSSKSQIVSSPTSVEVEWLLTQVLVVNLILCVFYEQVHTTAFPQLQVFLWNEPQSLSTCEF